MSVYVSVMLAEDCQCILQWCWLETVSVYFSGVGWRLSVYTSVVLAGDCWCILSGVGWRLSVYVSGVGWKLSVSAVWC